MATAFKHAVTWQQQDQGMTYLDVHVEGPLDAKTAKQVASSVAGSVEKLEGRPFGLLFDLRQVTACDEAGAKAMQGIELSAADKGLEKVAHLVAQKDLAQQAQAEVKAAGGAELLGTFDDENTARRFASGLV